jgi:SAM-dependent methyltransferase
MSVASWRRRFYPNPTEFDPHARLLQELERYVRPSSTVLDVGAGAGELNAYDLKGRVQHIAGVDFDPRVTTNPLLDSGIRLDSPTLPFGDNTFDLAFSIYVLEHVEQPAQFASELHRVLKPGGVFLSLTPNLRHYVPVIAALTPLSFHKWFNERRGRPGEDTFPTYYRLNTPGAQRRVFQSAGFHSESVTMFETQPNYLTFSTATFLAGVVYERVVNSSCWLSPLRVNIISAFQKPSHCEPRMTSALNGARAA